MPLQAILEADKSQRLRAKKANPTQGVRIEPANYSDKPVLAVTFHFWIALRAKFYTGQFRLSSQGVDSQLPNARDRNRHARFRSRDRINREHIRRDFVIAVDVLHVNWPQPT
jgi:hypothetical protein